MTHHSNRQPGGVENFVSRDVGYRYLGGRNQVEAPVVRQLEQVFLHLRQLAGAKQRVGIDDIGHVDFLVAMFPGMHVQHKLDQCPV